MKYKIRTYLHVNGYGAYVLLGTLIFFLLTIILYPSFYSGNASIWNMMSWGSFYVLLGGLIGGLILAIPFKGKLAPIVLAATSVTAFGIFVQKTYKYISAAFVGIDSQFTPQFIIIFILYILCMVLSFVALFKMTSLEIKEVPNEKEN